MDPVRTCALCPKLCRFACPVAGASGDENALPTAMGALILLRDAGALRYQADNTHPLYRCTGCLGCQVPCEFSVDVPAFLATERERAWDAGAVDPAITAACERVAAGEPADADAGHHAELDGPRFAGDGIVYWPGCALVGADPQAVERTRQLLADELGLPVLLPPSDAPACCGDPLRSAGDRFRYLAHRASLARALRGATRVITSCACCLPALPDGAEHLAAVLGYRWPEHAGPVEPVAFHDPCRLVRPDDRSGGPRALLDAATGAPVVEFVDRGVETACCGAGDSFGVFFSADARATAALRLRDPAVERTGVVVTACSRCAAQLAAAAPDGVEVRDLGDHLQRLRGR